MGGEHDRYDRQVLLPFIGREGQRRIGVSTVAIIGCGALGTSVADILARAGVGRIRLVDRDYVEWSNLQRQALFEEEDAGLCRPKAAAAARKLRQINSLVQVEAAVRDVSARNVESCLEGADAVVDACDNFETRFLLNDAAVKLKIPLVYGACVGSTGMVFAIIPSRTPCLRCVFGSPPPPGVTPTCDTAGILGPAARAVAAFQAAETLKILTGRTEAVRRGIVQFDMWGAEARMGGVTLPEAPSSDCPCCAMGRYEFLEGADVSRDAVLCGRGAVQVTPGGDAKLDLDALFKRIRGSGIADVSSNEFLVRFTVPEGLEIIA
ncbi:MAG: ThiF family adenylyltransferase, partial [Planctomycetota bacterium]|nr:ThiF family adenylyltransferase [Planctomycetota bacterium]